MAFNSSIEWGSPVPYLDNLHFIYPSSAFLDSGVAAFLKHNFFLPEAILSLLTNNARLVFVFLLVSLPFVVNYLVFWLYFQASQRSKGTGKMPPTIPYMVPFLGSTIPYLWNPSRFVRSSTLHFGKQMPVGVRLLTSSVYLLQGAENITALWRNSSISTATTIHSFCLMYFFGMPKKAVKIYTLDDSGSYHQPHPESNVKPENRVDYRTNQSLLRFLSGPGLSPFFERFRANLTKRLQALEIGDGWIEMPDFLEFFQLEITPVVIEAMCGPVLFSQNPDFARDFWEYNLWLPALSKGLPRFLIPEAYEIRDKILNNIKQWHAYARKHFDRNQIDADGDADPFWGCEFIRARQDMFLSMDEFDYDALASSDFGAIWAANTNAILAAFWANLEIFRDPNLLLKIRHNIRSSFDSPVQSKHHFDIEKLVRQPLLQSVYAETLRLRVHVYMTRCPERQNLEVNGWTFPKDKVVLVSSTPAHLDENAWNCGPNDSQPLTQFWAERFLIYPNDPQSGPQKKKPKKTSSPDPNPPPTHHQETQQKDTSEPEPEPEPEFSTTGMTGSWIPYGGGPRACPGRHFAKREIMTICALLVSLFDIEICADDQALEMNPADYGLGTLRPADKVPFRIRRRRGGGWE